MFDVRWEIEATPPPTGMSGWRRQESGARKWAWTPFCACCAKAVVAQRGAQSSQSLSDKGSFCREQRREQGAGAILQVLNSDVWMNANSSWAV